MVAGRHVATLDYHVSPESWIGGYRLRPSPVVDLLKAELVRRPASFYQSQGTRHVEPHRIRLAGGLAARDLGGAQIPANTGIKRGAIRVQRTRPSRSKNFSTRRKTGIEKVHAFQLPGGSQVICKVFRLPQNGTFPLQAKPGQNLINGLDVVLARAGLIYILDPQEKPAAQPLRELESNEG